MAADVVPLKPIVNAQAIAVLVTVHFADFIARSQRRLRSLSIRRGNGFGSLVRSRRALCRFGVRYSDVVAAPLGVVESLPRPRRREYLPVGWLAHPCARARPRQRFDAPYGERRSRGAAAKQRKSGWIHSVAGAANGRRPCEAQDDNAWTVVVPNRKHQRIRYLSHRSLLQGRNAHCQWWMRTEQRAEAALGAWCDAERGHRLG